MFAQCGVCVCVIIYQRRHSREGGNPSLSVTTDQAWGSWIPACAGMTLEEIRPHEIKAVMPVRTIHIAAALIIRPDRHTLLVRKAGTAVFMQPGGKIEPGETPAAALARELEEELGLIVSPAELAALGRFEAIAANEPDARVVAECFRLETGAPVAAAREIAELIWIDPRDPPSIPLAPLSADHLLPLWRSGRFFRA